MLAEAADLLARPEFRGATLAIPDALLALPVSFYSPPELRSRIVFPADSKLALQYLGNDSVHISLERLHAYIPLRTESLVPFFGRTAENILVLNAAYFPGNGSSFFGEYLRSQPELAARAKVIREYPFGSVVLLPAR